jgi:hypothetical protein
LSVGTLGTCHRPFKSMHALHVPPLQYLAGTRSRPCPSSGEVETDFSPDLPAGGGAWSLPPANSVDSPRGLWLGTICPLLSDMFPGPCAKRRQAIPRLRVYRASRLSASLHPNIVSFAGFLLSHVAVLHTLIGILLGLLHIFLGLIPWTWNW